MRPKRTSEDGAALVALLLGIAVILAVGTTTAIGRWRRGLEPALAARGSDSLSEWDCAPSLAAALVDRAACLPPRLDHGAPGRRNGLAPEALCFLLEKLDTGALAKREGLACD